MQTHVNRKLKKDVALMILIHNWLVTNMS